MNHFRIILAAIIAAACSVALSAVPTAATPPSQHYSLETSHTVGCGTATITLRNQSPWIYPVSYSTDGSTPGPSGPNYGPVVDNRGDAPDDQTGSKTLTFPEDSGVVTVKYTVQAGTESDLWRGKPVGEVTTFTVETDCEPNIEEIPAPYAPEVFPPTCEENGYAVGVTALGATLTVNGTVQTQSEQTYGPGNYTFTYTADEGYAFPEGAQTSFNVTVLYTSDAEGCEEEPPVEPPVEEPPTPEEPEVPDTPTPPQVTAPPAAPPVKQAPPAPITPAVPTSVDAGI